MQGSKIKRSSIPGILSLLNDATEDNDILWYENVLMCMFLSPIFFLGSAAILMFQGLLRGEMPGDVLVNAAFLFLAGTALEVFRRIRLNDTLQTHIISALYSITFLFCLFRYYNVIGPSIWTLGFIQVLLSMVRTTKTMLTYMGLTMLGAGIYVTFIISGRPYNMSGVYYQLQFVFFTLLFIVSLTVHTISRNRIARIRRDLFELQRQEGIRKEAEEKNIELVLYDQLTGLPNRSLFCEKLEQAMLRAKKEGSPLYVLLIDLDLFKTVNDTLGRLQGDEVLALVGRRLEDALPGDIVSRVGSDEFMMFTQKAKSVRAISAIAANILESINEPYALGGQTVTLSCSIGIARYPEDSQEVEQLLKYSNLAMYKAKNEGKNRFECFTKTLEQSYNYDLDMLYHLKTAIENNEFELFYQPQIDSSSHTLAGFEALIRWNSPVLGRINPLDFLPLAEKAGLMAQIGEWVLRTACRQNKLWQERGYANVPMAVNISTNQFRNGAVEQQVQAILAETGLNPGSLELEITEQLFISDIAAVKAELNRLKELGVKIAIDDFGTGYSCIQYLKELPIDRIKIPREFIHGIGRDEKDESIISVLIAMARNLNMDIIAEGVETGKQLDFLRDRKCAIIQGFYYSKPVPASIIEDYMVNGHSMFSAQGEPAEAV